MTTETKTVTVEMSVESAYRQLVAFQQAAADFRKADEEGDTDAQLAAANDAVDASISLINEIMPDDLSFELHARLEEEHPELVDRTPDIQSIIEALSRAMASGEA